MKFLTAMQELNFQHQMKALKNKLEDMLHGAVSFGAGVSVTLLELKPRPMYILPPNWVSILVMGALSTTVCFVTTKCLSYLWKKVARAIAAKKQAKVLDTPDIL